jgi:hypothetical protein
MDCPLAVKSERFTHDESLTDASGDEGFPLTGLGARLAEN